MRLNGSPNRNKLQPIQALEEDVVQIAETKLNGGLVLELDPADIKDSQSQVHTNFRIFADKLIRSPGKAVLTPTKPDSNKVLLYTNWERFDGSVVELRFTATAVQKKGAGSWTTLTTGAALTATDAANINFTIINDRFFFANGVDPVQEIDTTVATYDVLGNCGVFKYLMGFFNRLVVSGTPTNPILTGWSGDLNFAEFNPLVDISAGSNPLIEGQSDYAEAITGTFGFASVALYLRERSLWIATKNPSASNPFAFQAAFPFGCDCPGSATQTARGIAWYDQRTNEVYNYEIGNKPEPIGTAIRSFLRSLVTDKNLLVGSYDADKDQYVLAIPSVVSNTTTLAIFDYQTTGWYIEEIANCIGVYNLSDGGSVLTIGDLVGDIGSLVGDISDLVNSMATPANRFYALDDGDILYDDPLLDTVNGVTMISRWHCKLYTLPVDDVNVAELHIKYIATRSCSFTLEYSRDKGETFTPYKTITVTPAMLGKRQTVICKKNLRVKEYVFRIVSSAGSFSVLEFVLLGYSAAEKSEG